MVKKKTPNEKKGDEVHRTSRSTKYYLVHTENRNYGSRYLPMYSMQVRYDT